MNLSHDTKMRGNARSMANFLLSTCLALNLVGCATPGSSNIHKANVAPQYVTEVGIMRILGDQAVDSNAQGFPIVFSPEEINVRVYRDAEEPLASYKTFDFDYTNKTNPLLEKELFRQLEKVLQSHGLARVAKDPQITISINFFIGKKEQYTPPNTVTSTEIKSVWNSGMIGWNVGGYSSAVPITNSTTTPGYTTTSYYSNIRLNFLNHAKLVEGTKLETPPMIWLGEADNEGTDPDIRGIAPVMFGELMREFPDQTSMASERYVRRFRYGGLGLGFDPSDWHIIRYVEPSSVAAENGIKPGDLLLRINGENVNTYVPFSLWYIPSSSRYRVKDPYFLYILSNHGDSNVDVVVKSAKTGKKVTFQMKPRHEDRYVYVNSFGTPLQKTKE